MESEERQIKDPATPRSAGGGSVDALEKRIAELESERDGLRAELERVRRESERTIAQLQARLGGAAEVERTAPADRVAAPAAGAATPANGSATPAASPAPEVHGRLQSAVDDVERLLRTVQSDAATIEVRLGSLNGVASRLVREHEAAQARAAALVSARNRAGLDGELLGLAATIDAMRGAAEEARNVGATLTALSGTLADLQRRSAQSRRDAHAQREGASGGAATGPGGLLPRLDLVDAQIRHLDGLCVNSSCQLSVLAQDLTRVNSSTEMLRHQLREERNGLAHDAQAATAAGAAARDELQDVEREIADQRLHLSHMEEITQEMKAARQPAPPATRQPVESPAAAAESGEATSEAAAATQSNSGIFVFDEGPVGEGTVRRLDSFGISVGTMNPGVDLADALKNQKVSSVAINLAMPYAWGLARRLLACTATADAALFAYALAPGAKRGFWFGRIGFFVPTVDDSNVTSVLQRLTPVVKRVISVSTDLDAVEEVRPQLERAAIAATFVRNAQQVRETIPKAQPQAALIQLSPRCFDIFPAISVLRAAESSRFIPILFLLDTKAQPRDLAFFSAGVRMLADKNPIEPAEIVNLLTMSLKVIARRK